MERRTNTRKAVKHEVLLSCHDIGLVKGFTENMSENGAFIVTPTVSFKTQSDIDVCFVIKQQNKTDIHRVAAKITRIENNGLAVSFNQHLSNSQLFKRVLH